MNLPPTGKAMRAIRDRPVRDDSIENAAAPLRDAWYYAVPSARLRRGRMLARVMLGEPVLLGRDAAGAVFALRDLCPHRGMPLSAGRFDGSEVECCYHGWRFDTGGRCTLIPSLVPGQAFSPDRIRTRALPGARDAGQHLGILRRRAGRALPRSRCSTPLRIGRPPDLVENVAFAAPIDHAVVGLMDPAHGPFVHRAWWWRSRRSIHAKGQGIRSLPRSALR